VFALYFHKFFRFGGLLKQAAFIPQTGLIGSINPKGRLIHLERRSVMKNEDEKLIDEVLKVYKIPSEYVFAVKAYPETQEAVVVTNGGKKVRHRKGEKAKFILTEVDITGEIPKHEMVWDDKLNQRRKRD
jgi:hypothetical protein